LINIFVNKLLESSDSEFISLLKAFRHLNFDGLGITNCIGPKINSLPRDYMALLDDFAITQTLLNPEAPHWVDLATYALFLSSRYSDVISLLNTLKMRRLSTYTPTTIRNYLWSACLLSNRFEFEKFVSELDNKSVVSVEPLINFCSSLFSGTVASVRSSHILCTQFQITAFSKSALETSYCHHQGVFAENNMLDEVASKINIHNFLDIGCLVGNHALYFERRFNLKQILCVDWDDRCCAATSLNFKHNNIQADKYAIVHANAVLGESSTDANNHHIGVPALDLLNLPLYDFIKIDLDGLEHKFLVQNLEYFIRTRPIILIEINHVNLSEVKTLVQTMQYSILKVGKTEPGRDDDNYLLLPEAYRQLS